MIMDRIIITSVRARIYLMCSMCVHELEREREREREREKKEKERVRCECPVTCLLAC
jgi:hypothetical protein